MRSRNMKSLIGMAKLIRAERMRFESEYRERLRQIRERQIAAELREEGDDCTASVSEMTREFIEADHFGRDH
ncbi:MAG TPA: hypothetical protein VFA52_04290 [Candidatus Paceibacterota bacterium]|nr:hypothetical protein [Candidatus Paceibacterota bacterium]